MTGNPGVSSIRLTIESADRGILGHPLKCNTKTKVIQWRGPKTAERLFRNRKFPKNSGLIFEMPFMGLRFFPKNDGAIILRKNPPFPQPSGIGPSAKVDARRALARRFSGC